MMIDADNPLAVADWGRVGYAEALERQRQLNASVVAGDAPPTLVLLEHEPVITVTRRAQAENLVASPQALSALGIAVHETDRGGDITYHGPGQLVAYPILKLNHFGLNLGRYMRLLERVVIRTADAFGVAAHAEPGATGVWVDRPGGSSAKLCALGVRVRKNTTMHGLALNVTTDLSHFQTIVPCGLRGRAVTSLHELLGDRCPGMPRVKQALTDAFEHELNRRHESSRPAEASR